MAKGGKAKAVKAAAARLKRNKQDPKAEAQQVGRLLLLADHKSAPAAAASLCCWGTTGMCCSI
jgi:hypothetical protein